MPYTGNKPSAVPLTSADIADSIITSAKIVDATIANADIANSTINLTTKVTGTLPLTNGGTGLATLGTAAQELRVNSGATALEYYTPTVASSDFVLLATTDASSSASVSFDGYFTSTYKNYQILISDVYPATANTTLSCRFRRSNADVTASNYQYAGRRTHQIGGGSDVNDGRYAYTATSFEVLTNSSPSSATRTTSASITIYSPLSTTSYKKIRIQGNGASDDGGGSNGIWNTDIFGNLYDNANALSGITFYYSSGNITAGNFKLYGIK